MHGVAHVHEINTLKGDTSGVGGVRVPEGSSQGSSTRSSSGTTVTKI